MRVWFLVLTAAVVGLVVGLAIDGKLWHQHFVWGDVPTWLLVLGASVAAWLALLQLGSQQEVARKDTEDRRRAQAARVFIGQSSVTGVALYVENASEVPVYDAQLWYYGPDGVDPNPDDLGMIMPCHSAPGASHRDDPLPRTFLTFRDANSVRWIRLPSGILEEQSAKGAYENAVARIRRVSVTQHLR